MIIGVTHDQDGRVIQRLSVSTKVSIGLPPNGDCNHPTKLDHFVFLRKKKSANRVGWEVDPELTEHYGERVPRTPHYVDRRRHRERLSQLLCLVDGHRAEVLGRRNLGHPAHG